MENVHPFVPHEIMVVDLAGRPFIPCVAVPAGVFLMGSKSDDTDAFDDEKPQREVFLDWYYIQKYPITKAQFAHFIDETDYAGEGELFLNDWVDGPNGRRVPPAGMSDHPVTYVSWYDSRAFCEAYGLFLPSEAQWEKAARGTDGRKYPWGNEPPSQEKPQCNFGGLFGGTTPVGIFDGTHESHNNLTVGRGTSPYGAEDMAGNVWEWCMDKWSSSWLADMENDKDVGVPVNPCNEPYEVNSPFVRPLSSNPPLWNPWRIVASSPLPASSDRAQSGEGRDPFTQQPGGGTSRTEISPDGADTSMASTGSLVPEAEPSGPFSYAAMVPTQASTPESGDGGMETSSTPGGTTRLSGEAITAPARPTTEQTPPSDSSIGEEQLEEESTQDTGPEAEVPFPESSTQRGEGASATTSSELSSASGAAPENTESSVTAGVMNSSAPASPGDSSADPQSGEVVEEHWGVWASATRTPDRTHIAVPLEDSVGEADVDPLASTSTPGGAGVGSEAPSYTRSPVTESTVSSPRTTTAVPDSQGGMGADPLYSDPPFRAAGDHHTSTGLDTAQPQLLMDEEGNIIPHNKTSTVGEVESDRPFHTEDRADTSSPTTPSSPSDTDSVETETVSPPYMPGVVVVDAPFTSAPEGSRTGGTHQDTSQVSGETGLADTSTTASQMHIRQEEPGPGVSPLQSSPGELPGGQVSVDGTTSLDSTTGQMTSTRAAQELGAGSENPIPLIEVEPSAVTDDTGTTAQIECQTQTSEEESELPLSPRAAHTGEKPYVQVDTQQQEAGASPLLSASPGRSPSATSTGYPEESSSAAPGRFTHGTGLEREESASPFPEFPPELTGGISLSETPLHGEPGQLEEPTSSQDTGAVSEDPFDLETQQLPGCKLEPGAGDTKTSAVSGTSAPGTTSSSPSGRVSDPFVEPSNQEAPTAITQSAQGTSTELAAEEERSPFGSTGDGSVLSSSTNLPGEIIGSVDGSARQSRAEPHFEESDEVQNFQSEAAGSAGQYQDEKASSLSETVGISGLPTDSEEEVHADPFSPPDEEEASRRSMLRTGSTVVVTDTSPTPDGIPESFLSASEVEPDPLSSTASSPSSPEDSNSTSWGLGSDELFTSKSPGGTVSSSETTETQAQTTSELRSLEEEEDSDLPFSSADSAGLPGGSTAGLGIEDGTTPSQMTGQVEAPSDPFGACSMSESAELVSRDVLSTSGTVSQEAESIPAPLGAVTSSEEVSDPFSSPQLGQERGSSPRSSECRSTTQTPDGQMNSVPSEEVCDPFVSLMAGGVEETGISAPSPPTPGPIPPSKDGAGSSQEEMKTPSGVGTTTHGGVNTAKTEEPGPDVSRPFGQDGEHPTVPTMAGTSTTPTKSSEAPIDGSTSPMITLSTSYTLGQEELADPFTGTPSKVSGSTTAGRLESSRPGEEKMTGHLSASSGVEQELRSAGESREISGEEGVSENPLSSEVSGDWSESPEAITDSSCSHVEDTSTVPGLPTQNSTAAAAEELRNVRPTSTQSPEDTGSSPDEPGAVEVGGTTIPAVSTSHGMESGMTGAAEERVNPFAGVKAVSNGVLDATHSGPGIGAGEASPPEGAAKRPFPSSSEESPAASSSHTELATEYTGVPGGSDSAPLGEHADPFSSVSTGEPLARQELPSSGPDLESSLQPEESSESLPTSSLNDGRDSVDAVQVVPELEQESNRPFSQPGEVIAGQSRDSATTPGADIDGTTTEFEGCFEFEDGPQCGAGTGTLEAHTRPDYTSQSEHMTQSSGERSETRPSAGEERADPFEISSPSESGPSTSTGSTRAGSEKTPHGPHSIQVSEERANPLIDIPSEDGRTTATGSTESDSATTGGVTDAIVASGEHADPLENVSPSEDGGTTFVDSPRLDSATSGGGADSPQAIGEDVDPFGEPEEVHPNSDVPGADVSSLGTSSQTPGGQQDPPGRTQLTAVGPIQRMIAGRRSEEGAEDPLSQGAGGDATCLATPSACTESPATEETPEPPTTGKTDIEERANPLGPSGAGHATQQTTEPRTIESPAGVETTGQTKASTLLNTPIPSRVSEKVFDPMLGPAGATPYSEGGATPSTQDLHTLYASTELPAPVLSTAPPTTHPTDTSESGAGADPLSQRGDGVRSCTTAPSPITTESPASEQSTGRPSATTHVEAEEVRDPFSGTPPSEGIMQSTQQSGGWGFHTGTTLQVSPDALSATGESQLINGGREEAGADANPFESPRKADTITSSEESGRLQDGVSRHLSGAGIEELDVECVDPFACAPSEDASTSSSNSQLSTSSPGAEDGQPIQITGLDVEDVRPPFPPGQPMGGVTSTSSTTTQTAATPMAVSSTIITVPDTEGYDTAFDERHGHHPLGENEHPFGRPSAASAKSGIGPIAGDEEPTGLRTIQQSEERADPFYELSEETGGMMERKPGRRIESVGGQLSIPMMTQEEERARGPFASRASVTPEEQMDSGLTECSPPEGWQPSESITSSAQEEEYSAEYVNFSSAPGAGVGSNTTPSESLSQSTESTTPPGAGEEDAEEGPFVPISGAQSSGRTTTVCSEVPGWLRWALAGAGHSGLPTESGTSTSASESTADSTTQAEEYEEVPDPFQECPESLLSAPSIESSGRPPLISAESTIGPENDQETSPSPLDSRAIAPVSEQRADPFDLGVPPEAGPGSPLASDGTSKRGPEESGRELPVVAGIATATSTVSELDANLLEQVRTQLREETAEVAEPLPFVSGEEGLVWATTAKLASSSEAESTGQPATGERADISPPQPHGGIEPTRMGFFQQPRLSRTQDLSCRSKLLWEVAEPRPFPEIEFVDDPGEHMNQSQATWLALYEASTISRATLLERGFGITEDQMDTPSTLESVEGPVNITLGCFDYAWQWPLAIGVSVACYPTFQTSVGGLRAAI